MLFDFATFVEELRENPEKKETIEKYEKFFGPITGDYKDQIWYKEYVTTFKSLPYRVPEELKEDFDWDFLMMLVASSLSSDGTFDTNIPVDQEDKSPDFIITVHSGDQTVVKKMSELWGFQILRLYEIYIEEQMNLQILMAEDEKEKEAIVLQRENRINRWNIVMDNLQREESMKIEKQEKDSKLSDLMSQL